MDDIERAYTGYIWHGAESANDVTGLPPWLHQYLIGWSGECLYISTNDGEYTVEIGDKIEYSMIGEGNGYLEYVTISKAA